MHFPLFLLTHAHPFFRKIINNKKCKNEQRHPTGHGSDGLAPRWSGIAARRLCTKQYVGHRSWYIDGGSRRMASNINSRFAALHVCRLHSYIHTYTRKLLSQLFMQFILIVSSEQPLSQPKLTTPITTAFMETVIMFYFLCILCCS
jgi:hypothetical protein